LTAEKTSNGPHPSSAHKPQTGRTDDQGMEGDCKTLPTEHHLKKKVTLKRKTRKRGGELLPVTAASRKHPCVQREALSLSCGHPVVCRSGWGGGGVWAAGRVCAPSGLVKVEAERQAQASRLLGSGRVKMDIVGVRQPREKARCELEGEAVQLAGTEPQLSI